MNATTTEDTKAENAKSCAAIRELMNWFNDATDAQREDFKQYVIEQR